MSGDPTRNPFADLRLDPRSSPEEITAVMRELAEDAPDAQRRTLQGQWRKLTLHPDDRLKAAFFAHTNPSRNLIDTLDRDTLTRLRLTPRRIKHSEALDPAAAPELADLVLLPPLRAEQSADGTERPSDWPDVAPQDDVFLKL